MFRRHQRRNVPYRAEIWDERGYIASRPPEDPVKAEEERLARLERFKDVIARLGTAHQMKGNAYHLYSASDTAAHQLSGDWMRKDAEEWEMVKEACRLHLIDLETFVGRPKSIRVTPRFTTFRVRELTLP